MTHVSFTESQRNTYCSSLTQNMIDRLATYLPILKLSKIADFNLISEIYETFRFQFAFSQVI